MPYGPPPPPPPPPPEQQGLHNLRPEALRKLEGALQKRGHSKCLSWHASIENILDNVEQWRDTRGSKNGCTWVRSCSEEFDSCCTATAVLLWGIARQLQWICVYSCVRQLCPLSLLKLFMADLCHYGPRIGVRMKWDGAIRETAFLRFLDCRDGGI